jgi:predicted nucleic acid-binding protein
MKETAIEWLMEEMSKTYIFNQDDFDMFKQAKEMEKQQQGYSEEDMTNYALYILHNDVITPKEWFEKFKNK